MSLGKGIVQGTVFLMGLGAGFAGDSMAQPIPVWEGAPITYMSQEDIRLFSEALGKTLADGKDGVESRWENPETRANGSIKAVRTFEGDKARCRDIFLDNYAKGRREKGTYAFCQDFEGKWQFSPGAGVKKTK